MDLLSVADSVDMRFIESKRSLSSVIIHTSQPLFSQFIERLQLFDTAPSINAMVFDMHDFQMNNWHQENVHLERRQIESGINFIFTNFQINVVQKLSTQSLGNKMHAQSRKAASILLNVLASQQVLNRYKASDLPFPVKIRLKAYNHGCREGK
eukprot:215923_1